MDIVSRYFICSKVKRVKHFVSHSATYIHVWMITHYEINRSQYKSPCELYTGHIQLQIYNKQTNKMTNNVWF